jgi:hypothetical protein
MKRRRTFGHRSFCIVFSVKLDVPASVPTHRRNRSNLPARSREGAWIDWLLYSEPSATRHNIPNTSSESTWQLSRLRLVGFD